jgi:outer membrane protein assembly factor BamB
LARQRKALAKRQSDVVKEIRKLGDKPETAAKRDALKAELTGIGTKVDELTAGMENCLAWKIPCRWPLALVLAGNTVVTGGEDEVAGFNATDGKAAWKLPVRGKAYGLAAADGALLVSTDSGTIHCFRAPTERAALQIKETQP